MFMKMFLFSKQGALALRRGGWAPTNREIKTGRPRT